MPTDILVYIRLVVCTAWGHSASLARNIIFYVVVIAGTAGLLVPIIGMTIDAAGLLALISNPESYAILFGSIVIARFICAPYWIWQAQQAKIAALDENLERMAAQETRTAIAREQEERNCRRNKVLEILHDYQNSHNNRPTTLHSLLDQAMPYINAELKADGKNWTFNETTRQELGFPPSRKIN